MNITLKDGSVKSYEAPVSAADVCKDLSMGLYRAACSCRINGEVKDLRTVIDGDSTLEILTFDDEMCIRDSSITEARKIIAASGGFRAFEPHPTPAWESAYRRFQELLSC